MSEAVPQAIRLLVSLLKLARLHDGLENVVFAEQVPACCEALAAALEGERGLHVEARDGLVLVNRRIQKGLGQQTQDECEAALGALGLCGLWVGRALSEDELRRLLLIVQAAGGRDDPAASIQAALGEWGLAAVLRAIPIGEGGGTADQRTVQVGSAEYFPLAYARLLVLLRELARNAEHAELTRYFRQKLLRAAGELARLAPRYPRRVLALTSIRVADDPVFTRVANGGLLALLLGVELGFDRRALAELATASLTNGVADAFARDAEASPQSRRQRVLRELVDRHDLSSAALSTAAVGLALHADALHADAPGAEAHPYGRLLRVIDAYQQALAAGRRPDEAIQDVLARADGAAAELDDLAARALANLLGEFPAGTCVRLRGGEVCVVVYPNPGFPGRPLVAVAREADGRDGAGRLLDLAERDVQGEFRAAIAEAVDPIDHEIVASDYLLG